MANEVSNHQLYRLAFGQWSYILRGLTVTWKVGQGTFSEVPSTLWRRSEGWKPNITHEGVVLPKGVMSPRGTKAQVYQPLDIQTPLSRGKNKYFIGKFEQFVTQGV